MCGLCIQPQRGEIPVEYIWKLEAPQRGAILQRSFRLIVFFIFPVLPWSNRIFDRPNPDLCIPCISFQLF